jgi:hypothetical protein
MAMPENRGQGTGPKRISHDIIDISSTAQLLRFAVAGQLARVTKPEAGLSQAKIAQAAGFGNSRQAAGVNLSKALAGEKLSSEKLRNLDGIIGVLAPDLEGTGGLSSLALRLSGEGRAELRDSMTADVPPSWTRRILEDPPAGDVGVLIQASALLSAFISAEKLGAAASVERRYGQELDTLVRRLILISAEPPTSRNYDAQILLGILAHYAFESMRDRLEEELRISPLGFRVWRAITKLVRLSGGARHTDDLKNWVRSMVREAGELRDSSLYAGRGLDLELAISIPLAWSPPDDDWAGRALLARAREDKATIRERGTAVMGLWQRAITQERTDRKETQRDLRKLVTEFRGGESRPDAKAGLNWIAVTLEHAMERGIAVCNEFPDVHEEWFDCVDETAKEIYLPAHLQKGAQSLFRHMILQNAGVYRRQAIETVVTSGWNEPVARALGSLLNKLEAKTDETWLRVRVEFALGLLGKHSLSVVREDLTRACRHAFSNVKPFMDGLDREPWRAHITEMHSSLFAVGDCFGVAGAEDNARVIRDNIADILINLVEMGPERGMVMRRAARAAAYTLTMTAQDSRGGQPDLSKVLLEKLSGHPDQVTARLSEWALKFRFAANGTTRPLLDAAGA